MGSCCLALINKILGELEGSLRAHSDVDSAYKNVCAVIQAEMLKKKLAHRKIMIYEGLSNKLRRVRKPWWKEDLLLVWNVVCLKEKL